MYLSMAMFTNPDAMFHSASVVRSVKSLRSENIFPGGFSHSNAARTFSMGSTSVSGEPLESVTHHDKFDRKT
jgi:hypothetical protein